LVAFISDPAQAQVPAVPGPASVLSQLDRCQQRVQHAREFVGEVRILFFSLRQFGHLCHSGIKTRRNNIHQSVFSVITTELTEFFSIISKKFGLSPRKTVLALCA